DLLVLPPGTLVALLMEFSVMQPAHGNREPVADFSAHRPLLCKLDMVGIRRGSAADKAGLRGHKLQVVTVALRRWLADDDDRVFTSIDMQRVIVTAIRLPRFLCQRLKFGELAQLGREGALDRLGIRCRELVFNRERP